MLDRLHKDPVAALAQPTIQERRLPLGFELVVGSREEFGTFIREDIAKRAKVDAGAS